VLTADALASAAPFIPAHASGPRRRIFYVGDNRTGVNWGRGASLALRQLLVERFTISAVIAGEQLVLATAEAGYVNTLLPARCRSLFRQLLRRRNRWPFSWYLRLEHWWGATDFIDHDPRVSVDRLLAARHQHPALAGIYEAAAAAELMVVDGDGDLILTTPPRRQTLYLLAMMELGIRLGKPVFLVNTMISDCPATGRNQHTLAAARRLFAGCAGVAVRDPESLAYLDAEMPKLGATLIPDSLFAWYPRYAEGTAPPPADGDLLLPFPEDPQLFGRLDYSRPYLCIGGGALAGTDPDRARRCYLDMVHALQGLGLGICLTESDHPDHFLRAVADEAGVGFLPAEAPILACGAVLAHARLFLSGRYHPSILAALGGTPSIFLGTHAHKMGSLSRLLEYETQREFPAFPEASDVAGIVALAKAYLQQGNALRQRIQRVAERRCQEARMLPQFIDERLTELAARRAAPAHEVSR
jgi:polysaccharide pyruvyl transferase WcaK-like protein